MKKYIMVLALLHTHLFCDTQTLVEIGWDSGWQWGEVFIYTSGDEHWKIEEKAPSDMANWEEGDDLLLLWHGPSGKHPYSLRNLTKRETVFVTERQD